VPTYSAVSFQQMGRFAIIPGQQQYLPAAGRRQLFYQEQPAIAKF
jgi:hypothetical protein